MRVIHTKLHKYWEKREGRAWRECRASVAPSEDRAGPIRNGVDGKLLSGTLPKCWVGDRPRRGKEVTGDNRPANLLAEAVSCCEQPGVTDEAGSALMACPFELEADLPRPLPFQSCFPPLDNPFGRGGRWQRHIWRCHPYSTACHRNIC